MSSVVRGLITVVMPCFNSAAHVERSVACVLSQTYHDIELLVVDDGSTDNSLEIVLGIADSRLRAIPQQNEGASAARNRAISEANGEYIAFLDSDDTWSQDFLEKMHDALVDRPDAVIAYCGWQNLGVSVGRGRPFVPPDYECPRKVELLLESCPWPIHACLTRTAAVRAAGGFDVRLQCAEDYALWLTLASANNIVRVEAVMAFYHHHSATQASANRILSAIQGWFVQQEFIREHPALIRDLPDRDLRRLTDGALLTRGLEAFWARDLGAAHAILRAVARTGYGSLRDWKYILPTVLPFGLYRGLVKLIDFWKFEQ